MHFQAAAKVFIHVLRSRQGVLRGALAAVLFVALVGWPAVARANAVVDWNQVALKTEPPVRLFQLTRAVAMTHVAMHDALNSIPGSARYTTYLPPVAAEAGASPEAAAHSAAHWILREYVLTTYPANTALLDEIEALYASSLAAIADGPAKSAGIATGEAAAAALWQARATDGWNNPNGLTYTFATPAPGVWRQVPGYPPTLAPPFFWWGSMTPWVLTSPGQFMAPAPLDITSAEFLADVAEVEAYGGSVSTARTEDQAYSAQWWGVCADNVFRLGQQLLLDYGTDLHESARIFALMSMAGADAMISNIYNKLTYNFWRPVSAIREAGNTSWTPFLPTPPNPEYPAGHAEGSGSVAYSLERFFPGMLPQPVNVNTACGARSFNRLSDAVEDVVNARVFGGMHYRNSGKQGAKLGKQIAHWTFDNYLKPLE